MTTSDNDIRNSLNARRCEVVMQNAQQAVVVVDRRGVIQLVNPAVQRIFGFHESELIGQRIEMLIPSRYRENHQSFIDIYMTTGISEIIQQGRVIEIQRKDQATRQVFIRVHETVIGTEHFFTAIIEDLSTEVLLKHRLKEGEDLLRILLDSNPSGIFMSDASAMRNVYVNHELCSIYEVPEEQLLLPGKWNELIHPEDMSDVMRVLQESVQARAPGEVIHRVNTPNGKLKWVHVRANPYYRLGKFAGFVGIVLDVTQYKNIELEIARKEDLLRQVTQGMPANVKYFDAEGRYLFVNAAVERSWNRPLSDFLGRHYRDVLPSFMLEAIGPRLDEALNGEAQTFEISVPGVFDKPRHFRTTYVPHVVEESVVGVTATAVDCDRHPGEIRPAGRL